MQIKKFIPQSVKSKIIRYMPDKMYLSRLYKKFFGKSLDLENPQLFNEKLNWLKLYDRRSEYTTMVDKYAAKEYVSKKIGETHIIPTLGVWKRFKDIDFDKLPEQFVLKCTHDSGGMVIVRDKNKMDKAQADKKLSACLKSNFYYPAREWPYKNVAPRIIAEKFMENEDGSGLRDYKFYCFNGEPKFLYISEGLENHATAKISFVNLDWTFAPYQRSDYKPFDTLPEKPKTFNEMIKYATILSEGIPFVRVDLYEINGSVYFSELTFTPCGGFMPFKDEKYDYDIGKYLKLPKVGGGQIYSIFYHAQRRFAA